MSTTIPTVKEYVVWVKNSGVRCNCDLDTWEPESITGHSWVCRIHKQALAMVRERKPLPAAPGEGA